MKSTLGLVRHQVISRHSISGLLCPYPLTLHLETTSTVDDLTGKIRTHRRSQEDVSDCDLDRHTWSLQRRTVNTERVHGFVGVSFGGWLKWGPAV